MAMSRSRNLFVMCSVLMGSLFAYSASVQLNDPDWYVWFPRYSCACIVNLTNSIISTKLNRQIAKLALRLGMFLFVKVVVEDFVNGISGFLSMDLSERVVREKTGSLLVIISMILQLVQSSAPDEPSRLVNYGEFQTHDLVGVLLLHPKPAILRGTKKRAEVLALTKNQ